MTTSVQQCAPQKLCAGCGHPGLTAQRAGQKRSSHLQTTGEGIPLDSRHRAQKGHLLELHPFSGLLPGLCTVTECYKLEVTSRDHPAGLALPTPPCESTLQFKSPSLTPDTAGAPSHEGLTNEVLSTRLSRMQLDGHLQLLPGNQQ